MNERKLGASTVLRIALTIGALPLLSGCILFALAPLPATVDVEVQDATRRGFDGIIVYVDQPGGTATYPAGTISRQTLHPVGPDTLFKIGSISKLYIAAASVKLVDDGGLSLDDTVAALLPDLAGRIENASTITVRMLLQHRSGIPDFIDSPGFSWIEAPQNTRESLELIDGTSARFSPDARHDYSNTNYVLIGEVLDRTLGYSHHIYIKDEILTPLGLNNTYSLFGEVDPDDVMSGYDLSSDDADWKPADYVLPGGSMVASADDTGRFLRALIDGFLFTSNEQDIYTSVYEYEHTGLLPGYQSIARYHSDIDAVVIQFTNVSGGDRWRRSETVYNRIVRILRRQ